MSSTPSPFAEKYGPWALVTGASSGIGAQFCRSLANRGLNVILVARREDRLTALASELSTSYSIETHIQVADLTLSDAAERIGEAVSQFDIGLLVNNAGIEGMRAYLTFPLEKVHHLIALNVTAVACMARVIGARIAKRGRGGMIFVSSISARPQPYVSLYAASKAFVTTLAVSMRYELSDYNVDVMAFEPGLVASEISDRVSRYFNYAEFGAEAVNPEIEVESCLKVFGKRDVHTPGWMNKLLKFIVDYLPAWFVMPYVAKKMQKALAPDRVTLAF